MKILVLQCRSIASELGRYRRLVAAVVTDRSVVEALRLVLLLECGCWRWWLANLGPTTESCGGCGVADCWRQYLGVGLRSMAVIVGCDRRWGRHWRRRCLCCCKPESMLAVMGVVGSGVWFDDGDGEQWTVGSCNQNSRFLNREFFFFRSNWI
jgi:hypothetical protein